MDPEFSNDITELRRHLFDTIRGLKTGSVKVEQAKAINQTAQTIINSAQAEIDMLSVVGGKGTGFIPDALPSGAPGKPGLPPGTSMVAQLNGATVTKHKL